MRDFGDLPLQGMTVQSHWGVKLFPAGCPYSCKGCAYMRKIAHWGTWALPVLISLQFGEKINLKSRSSLACLSSMDLKGMCTFLLLVHLPLCFMALCGDLRALSRMTTDGFQQGKRVEFVLAQRRVNQVLVRVKFLFSNLLWFWVHLGKLMIVVLPLPSSLSSHLAPLSHILFLN